MDSHRLGRTTNSLSMQSSGASRARGSAQATHQNRATPNDHSRRQRFLPYKSHRNYRTIRGTDAGLNVRHISKRRRRRLFGNASDTTVMYALLAISAVVLIALLVLVGGCVSSCVRGWLSPASTKVEVNAIDSRVSPKASDNLTQKLIPALNYSDTMLYIAQHAGEYTDERLVELAVNEPQAAEFVRTQLSSDGKASAYDGEIAKGTVPAVYNWDSHWGHVPFLSSVLGVDGSGLTALFMADAYLTGSNEHTPDVLAQSAGDYAEANRGVNAAFFKDKAAELGLSVKDYTPSADNIKVATSDATKAALVSVKEGFTSPYAHWVLLTGLRKDGSVVLFDPTSYKATNTSWALGSVADNVTELYSISVKAADKK